MKKIVVFKEYVCIVYLRVTNLYTDLYYMNMKFKKRHGQILKNVSNEVPKQSTQSMSKADGHIKAIPYIVITSTVYAIVVFTRCIAERSFDTYFPLKIVSCLIHLHFVSLK